MVSHWTQLISENIRDQDCNELELSRIAMMSTDSPQLEHTQHMPQYSHVIKHYIIHSK